MLKLLTTTTALAAVLVTAPAASAHDEASAPHRFNETTICVQVNGASGWRVGAAIRDWNAAQDAVHLSNVAVPGCGVIEIGEYTVNPAADPIGDWNGYTEWPAWNDGQWASTGVWSYHHASVMLSRSKRIESLKAIWKGTRQACWRKGVVAHEIGHALGLGHTSGTRSVMSSDRDHVKHCGTPSASDAAAVVALYSGS